jgi:hypothetical protein
MIEELQSALRDDNEANLRLYRDELSGLVEDAIILRRHYSRGVTAHNLPEDKTLAAAIEVLHDPARYREILTSQDTDRK